MREKVIFDTNIITNRDTNFFFGGRDMLMHFAADADIVIPDIVIQEIKMQKLKKLASKKDGFLSNPFHRFFALDETKTKAFDLDKCLEELLNAETIPYETIDLKDNNVLPKIKELAINGLPPFEEKEGTDKGIKDALIYFSILEYLDEIPNKYIFVCVKDNRFKLALEPHPNIHVIETYEEFKAKSMSHIFDEYFLEKAKDELGIEVSQENLVEYWININENQAVLMQIEDEEYILEVDSGEIISFEKRDKFKDLVQELITSDSNQKTLDTIERLTPFINYLSDDEINKLLKSISVNEHIFWTIEESDVKEFFGTLYKAKKELIDEETEEFSKEFFEIKKVS